MMRKVTSETNLIAMTLFQMSSATHRSNAPPQKEQPQAPFSPCSHDSGEEMSKHISARSIVGTPISAPYNSHPNLEDVASPVLSNECTGSASLVPFRYSPEERKLRVARYLAKKHQRSFKKQIRYVVRKKLADTRPRIKGRFSKPVAPEETQTLSASA